MGYGFNTQGHNAMSSHYRWVVSLGTAIAETYQHKGHQGRYVKLNWELAVQMLVREERRHQVLEPMGCRPHQTLQEEVKTQTS